MSFAGAQYHGSGDMEGRETEEQSLGMIEARGLLHCSDGALHAASRAILSGSIESMPLTPLVKTESCIG